MVSVLEKRFEELSVQLAESVARLESRLDQNEDRVGWLEGETTRNRSSLEKMVPQVCALQSKMTHITASPQVKNIVRSW